MDLFLTLPSFSPRHPIQRDFVVPMTEYKGQMAALQDIVKPDLPEDPEVRLARGEALDTEEVLTGRHPSGGTIMIWGLHSSALHSHHGRRWEQHHDLLWPWRAMLALPSLTAPLALARRGLPSPPQPPQPASRNWAPLDRLTFLPFPPWPLSVHVQGGGAEEEEGDEKEDDDFSDISDGDVEDDEVVDAEEKKGAGPRRDYRVPKNMPDLEQLLKLAELLGTVAAARVAAEEASVQGGDGGAMFDKVNEALKALGLHCESFDPKTRLPDPLSGTGRVPTLKIMGQCPRKGEESEDG